MVDWPEFTGKHICYILEYVTLPSGKIVAFCAICKKFQFYIEIDFESFGPDFEEKKIYPKPHQARYNDFNCELWK